MRTASQSAGRDVLREHRLPLFFEVAGAEVPALRLPADRYGQSIRVWARSLTVMQKEAVVVSLRSRRLWRLASDEGPYLNGFDSAPCPLSFLTTGMVCAYMNEILAAAGQRGVTVRDVILLQDNYYSMEGSALRGTMSGGALPVHLEVRIDCDADDATLAAVVTDAVRASPLDGLMREVHHSRFSLTLNERQIRVGRVAGIDGPAVANFGECFEGLRPSGDPALYAGLIGRLEAVEAKRDVPGGLGTSLAARQSRKLHVRGICRVRADGVREVTQHLYSPLGSTYRFLCDEAAGFGGSGLAPDAASYVAAGIAFCFMTQLGRYAKIVRRNLDEYRVIQDTYFPPGGASAGDAAGAADPVETHVHLRSSEDDDEFARRLVDMGEQTCFLHAFCRTPLDTRIEIRRSHRTITP